MADVFRLPAPLGPFKLCVTRPAPGSAKKREAIVLGSLDAERIECLSCMVSPAGRGGFEVACSVRYGGSCTGASAGAGGARCVVRGTAEEAGCLVDAVGRTAAARARALRECLAAVRGAVRAGEPLRRHLCAELGPGFAPFAAAAERALARGAADLPPGYKEAFLNAFADGRASS